VHKLLLALAVAASAQSADFPWPQDTPEHQGMSGKALDEWRDRLAAHQTKALLVVRGGKIVYEWYAAGDDANKKQGTASMAKAIAGGMSLMAAIDAGNIRPDDLASRYIPAWRDDPSRNRITIRHLATHTSGIEDAEQGTIPHMKLPGWKGAFWRQEPDPFTPAIHDAPVIFAPGSSNAYSNPGIAALGYAVTAAAKTDIKTLLNRLFDPLGIPASHWSIGYGKAFDIDGMKLWATWGGGAFTPRATARVGELMMHEGEWNGKQLVRREVARQMIRDAGMPAQGRSGQNPAPPSGLCWWLNSDGVWDDVPRDAFAGAGAQQQILLVIPSLDLIVVRNGGALGSGDRFWGYAVDEVIRPAARIAKSIH
jgi:CubicO group peptidase (beta-lactamase class C family)